MFSSHEHLGSVTSMGAKGWFFRIDQEKGCVPGPTGLADLLFSPYLGGQLAQLGLAPVPGESPEALCRRALPGLRELSTKGLAQALEFAFRELYGVSLWSLTPESAKKLDREIAGRYQNYYQWYRQVMERLGCEKVLRTVHPGYLVSQGPGAEEEERFVLPLVRVDTLLGYPEEGRVNFSYFQPVSGIAPDSLENLEESVRFLFSRLIDPYKIVGLKQFQAYLRTLDSPPYPGRRPGPPLSG